MNGTIDGSGVLRVAGPWSSRTKMIYAPSSQAAAAHAEKRLEAAATRLNDGQSEATNTASAAVDYMALVSMIETADSDLLSRPVPPRALHSSGGASSKRQRWLAADLQQRHRWPHPWCTIPTQRSARAWSRSRPPHAASAGLGTPAASDVLRFSGSGGVLMVSPVGATDKRFRSKTNMREVVTCACWSKRFAVSRIVNLGRAF